MCACALVLASPRMPTSDGEQMASAEAAYAAGDFVTARALSKALGASSDAEVTARARTLGARLTTDVAVWIALGGSLALFLGIVVAYAT